MSTTHESEGFVSMPLEGQGARRKDNYYLESEENEVRFREADNECRRLKEDFARIARNRRKEITLGVIRQKALHHAEDSLRDVQRAHLSSR